MSMRTMMVLVAMVVGCGTQQTAAPSDITLVADAAFQSDAALMTRVREAATLWSSVGATVHVATSGEGMPLQLLDDATWNSETQGDTYAAGMFDSDNDRIIIRASDYAQIQYPGLRIELLAHEIGHALGLSHVLGDQWAIMYRFTHALPAEGLRPADAAEYFSVHP